MKETAIILHDVRSVHNVGSIFRTADCAGVDRIFLSGYTPGPIDRFGRKRGDFAKVSLGAEDSVAWEAVPDTKALIVALRKEGFRVVAVEQSERSIDYKAVDVSGPTAIIFGNEVGGIPPPILELCDIVAEIPMKGEKESLNVSVAAGVALFRLLRL